MTARQLDLLCVFRVPQWKMRWSFSPRCVTMLRITCCVSRQSTLLSPSVIPLLTELCHMTRSETLVYYTLTYLARCRLRNECETLSVCLASEFKDRGEREDCHVYEY